MAKPTTSVPKAKLYKMISSKGIAKSAVTNTNMDQMVQVQNAGFKQMGSALNSIGASVNSIGVMLQSMNETFKSGITAQIQATDNLMNAQRDAASDKEKADRAELRAKRKEEGREADDLAEAEVEKPNLARRVGFAAGYVTGKVASGIAGFLASLGKLFMGLVGFAVLDWVAKNPEKVQKIMDVLGKIATFVWNTAKFLTGFALGGLSDFMENPTSLKGLLGIGKFFLVLAGIFAGPALAKMGLKLLLKGGIKLVIKPVLLLLKNVGKMLFNFGKIAAKGVFKAGKFIVKGAIKNPKAALLTGAAIGVGALAYNMFKGDSGAEEGEPEGTPDLGPTEDDLEDGGGDPIMDVDAVLASLDLNPDELADLQKTALADKLMYNADEIKQNAEEDAAESASEVQGAKGPIESALNFIIEPIKQMWAGITDIFGKIVDNLKKVFDEAMGFFGTVITRVGDFFSPYVDRLKKFGQDALGLILDPFFKMFDAVQQILEIFKDDDENVEEKAKGGYVPPPQFAKGGWISGPQSGYPVSLTGNGVDFIGHGTEWVGMKGFAGGGAFVVPFDTPATKGDPGLTQRRMGEAARGGFNLPGFAAGGELKFAKDMIKIHEGLKLHVYRDSAKEKNLTVGYGHLIDAGSPPDIRGLGEGAKISQSRANSLFEEDFKHHEQQARKIPGYKKASAQQKAALIDLTFNMGGAWYQGFPKFTSYFKNAQYEKAGEELRDSNWYSQVGRRAEPIISLIKGKGTGGAAHLQNLSTPTHSAGQQITTAQQNQDERIETAASTGSSNTQVAELPPINAPVPQEEGPPPLPALVGLPQREQAATKYMIPRFGLMNEHKTPPALLS
tara:strand:- start:4565 stop:7090 length:2526 start_codon:yes stop_codon:yes gene_type:complete